MAIIFNDFEAVKWPFEKCRIPLQLIDQIRQCRNEIIGHWIDLFNSKIQISFTI